MLVEDGPLLSSHRHLLNRDGGPLMSPVLESNGEAGWTSRGSHGHIHRVTRRGERGGVSVAARLQAKEEGSPQ
jgi:hypothetical protein